MGDKLSKSCWTWLDECVQNLIAVIIVAAAVVVLVASAFDPSVKAPPELLGASGAVLLFYGYRLAKK